MRCCDCISSRAALSGKLLASSTFPGPLSPTGEYGDGSIKDVDKTFAGGPGDGGIDGDIDQDPLGLESIYVQAKRHAAATQSAQVISAALQ